jgi:hypothetical protein
MRVASIEGSLVFGALAVLTTATLFAAAAFVAVLGISRMPTPEEAPFALEAMTRALPLLAPVMIFGFTAIFAVPAGLVAAIAYHLGMLATNRFHLPPGVLILVGAASGVVGAKIVFYSASHLIHLVGGLSGLIASVIWLLLPQEFSGVARSPTGDNDA